MRLGKNIGGYRGESIDIQKVLDELKLAAQQHGWRKDTFSITPQIELLAYHRANPPTRKSLYLSTGIHGDEPAGPLAVLQLVKENLWPSGIDVWLCPCLNLTGFPRNTRENANGIDLNRDYRHLLSEEVRAHVGWLKEKPRFDLALCLHEDWESGGFYVYELNPDHRPSFAETIIESVGRVCPIEPGPRVDNWEVQGGIVRPNISPEERPQWPESLFLITHKTRLSYTLEAPSDFPLSTRVAAHVTAVRTALDLLATT